MLNWNRCLIWSSFVATPRNTSCENSRNICLKNKKLTKFKVVLMKSWIHDVCCVTVLCEVEKRLINNKLRQRINLCPFYIIYSLCFSEQLSQSDISSWANFVRAVSKHCARNFASFYLNRLHHFHAKYRVFAHIYQVFTFGRTSRNYGKMYFLNLFLSFLQWCPHERLSELYVGKHKTLLN